MNERTHTRAKSLSKWAKTPTKTRSVVRQAALQDRSRVKFLSLKPATQQYDVAAPFLAAAAPAIAHPHKAAVVALLGNACQICGYNNNIPALSFLQIKNAQFNLNDEAAFGHPCKLVIKEVRKCVLLCPNCRAEVKAGMHNPSAIISLNEEVDCKLAKISDWGKLK